MWISSTICDKFKRIKKNKIIDKAPNLYIENLKKLSVEINNNVPSDRVATNDMYGHAYHIKKYVEIEEDKVLNCAIEHGSNIGNRFVGIDEVIHPVKTVLAFSEHRKKVIQELTQKTVIPVGPYISYADSYCSNEEIQRRKQKNGRTLLVFPSHSITGANAKYDMDNFILEINKVKKDFDKVMVCLFYQDVRIGLADVYKKQGYEVVCAGYIYDKFFLSRLKMIIQLSDAVIVNGYSTGVAYALCLDKPVYFYQQRITYTNELNYNFMKRKRDYNYLDELVEISSDRYFGNLQKQKEWGNYLFGFDCVKTKESLGEILKPLVRW